ncbi:hypothetical protein [Streptomyces sp. NPDC127033]|uniref:hypothetical protein n=1 Tax=Streptomyces sp. NPDC127033 TaxID=3347110 RepID=UPI00364BBD94
MFQTFATDELPSADRFDAFREQLAMAHAPMKVVSDHAAAYTACMWVLRLGPAWCTAYLEHRFSCDGPPA